MIRSELLIPLAYAAGTFPTARLVARRKGADIETSGSGNPGASNTARVLGWKSGVVVLLVDIAKGALPAGLGLWLDGRPGAWMLGIAATLGHIWPAQRKFRGGKGVATAGGLVWVIDPLVAAVILLIWGLVARLTGKASVASLIGIVCVPIAMAARGRDPWEVVAASAVAVILIVRHRSNLLRLFRGAEPPLAT
ncbi:MAG: glycerol-3-phosphate 1-O-acyltransferase PlsY [Acidimicrobiia bacterium]